MKHIPALSWLICGALAIIAGYYIFSYSYPLPIHEHLFLTDPLQKWSQQQSIGFWEPGYITIKGGHWYLTGNWLGLIFAWCSNWNLWVDTAAIYITLLAIFAAYVGMIQQLRPSKNIAVLLYVLAAVAAFSLDQAVNMLWHHQLSQFICILAIAITGLLLMFAEIKLYQHILLMVMVAIATYSTAAGLVLAVSVNMVMWLRPIGFKWRTVWLVLMVGLAAHYIYVFFYMDLVNHRRLPTPSVFHLTTAFKMLKFFMSAVGTSLSLHSPSVVRLWGGVGVVMAAIVLWQLQRHQRRDVVWHGPMVIMLTALGYLILASYGRYSGIAGGTNPRFISMGNMFWFSLMLLCWYARGVLTVIPRHLLLAVLAFALVFKTINIDHQASRWSQQHNKYTRVLKSIQEDWPDPKRKVLRKISWEGYDKTKERLKVLHRLEYGPFRRE